MSTEQQLTAVVNAANALTNVVTGKIDEIDRVLSEANAKYDEQLSSLNSRLPRLAVTKNFHMQPDSTEKLIDGWYVHTEVTATKVRTITQQAQSAGRPDADVEFMRQVQADVREQFPDFDIKSAGYWRNTVNVWQMKWSANDSLTWLAFPASIDAGRLSGTTPVPLNNCMTMGAFVRVNEGSIEGAWANGNKKGKWRWCSTLFLPDNVFANYMHVHPTRSSVTGSVDVMLAGACTGVITTPNDWGTLLGLG
ncbi:hypothetical protein [Pseudomonas sp. MUP55]|uniref:hypothetical protein n=1 Tax=Pseudomonas sp. MUP55 TaxID=3087234 RepID=UPI002A59FDA1|nr:MULTISPECIES: hypothetical protein [unclassified Pseudomonas]WPN93938.1 hypothetical protein SC319_06085 [Pseudomonas sp. MUP56]WPN99465.1 hypothetical protein SC318_06085 [Pseudomonas sp. MUP55]